MTIGGLWSIWNRAEQELTGIDGGTARVPTSWVTGTVVIWVIGSLDEQRLIDRLVLIPGRWSSDQGNWTGQSASRSGGDRGGWLIRDRVHWVVIDGVGSFWGELTV